MWLADKWKDYELLDCGRGEKLERWGDKILVRPDPQAIWNTPRKLREWRVNDGRYSRSNTGGGHWDKKGLPQHWTVDYGSLTFKVGPMNFKHTGLFPEQAANWDFVQEQIRSAGREISVLNLFAYTGEQQLPVRQLGQRFAMWMPRRVWSPGRKKMQNCPTWRMHLSVGLWMTAVNL